MLRHYILIRESKSTDTPHIGDVVRNAYLTLVSDAFYSALTREITFQLIISLSAILFIFFGIHLLFCVIAVPIVIIIIYLTVYSSFLIKSTELMSTKRPLQCWVAEACQPFFSASSPQDLPYRIITERTLVDEGIDVGHLQRKIIGTVSVSNFLMLEESAWLFRLAVESNYRHKGIGHALVETVKNWSRERRYKRVLLALSECQESLTRQLFVSTGFQMKQMYHKQILGSFLTLLMYQLECDLTQSNFQT